ncbi:hypothetical protein C8N32_106107 [Rhodovulum imhoffii]|uniref:DUF6455 domain-containing protein n=1 Tax=Rhodovulum imhoffii TaxID=365340 RepID=A0A2T5BT50_9RHOB|nr:DUF6455 family protein [Rhodovulum imhoffii]MBK5933821.1 hypothetical protein [Rhodovulum imhoffii]PTN02534.1 hypothetical protein C8N32_106107 [Rhodovulum imhoffii]
MEHTGKFTRHYWLTLGMARTIGVNLPEAMRVGDLLRDDFALMVAECCQCKLSSQCVAWMASQGAGAEDLPAWCILRPRLAPLREPA